MASGSSHKFLLLLAGSTLLVVAAHAAVECFALLEGHSASLRAEGNAGLWAVGLGIAGFGAGLRFQGRGFRLGILRTTTATGR